MNSLSKHRQIVYAFIDSQNLNLGVRSLGWKLDFKKFRVYLADKFRVSQVFLFLGFIEKYSSLYSKLKSFGYTLIFKPTINVPEGKTKGNVDAELVLHASAVEYSNYDKVIVVSGDGDFYCLYQYLKSHKKLLAIIIPNSKSESSLLKSFYRYKVYLDFERRRLVNKSGGRRS